MGVIEQPFARVGDSGAPVWAEQDGIRVPRPHGMGRWKSLREQFYSQQNLVTGLQGRVRRQRLHQQHLPEHFLGRGDSGQAVVDVDGARGQLVVLIGLHNSNHRFISPKALATYNQDAINSLGIKSEKQCPA
jgi:hypothetical protein